MQNYYAQLKNNGLSLSTHQHNVWARLTDGKFQLVTLKQENTFFQLPESRHRVSDWCVVNSKMSARGISPRV